MFRFQYTPSNSWFGLSTTGQVNVYDQGGFIRILNSTQETAAADIAELFDG